MCVVYGAGSTPAHVAVAVGNMDIFELLKASGADVTVANKEGKRATDVFGAAALHQMIQQISNQ